MEILNELASHIPKSNNTLFRIGCYLKEDSDQFEIRPADFNYETGVSFNIFRTGETDYPVAIVIVRLMNGSPVDALEGSFKADDAYVDVVLDRELDRPTEVDILTWIATKMKGYGFNNSIRLDGYPVHYGEEQPEDTPDENDIEHVDPELINPLDGNRELE